MKFRGRSCSFYSPAPAAHGCRRATPRDPCWWEPDYAQLTERRVAKDPCELAAALKGGFVNGARCSGSRGGMSPQELAARQSRGD